MPVSTTEQNFGKIESFHCEFCPSNLNALLVRFVLFSSIIQIYYLSLSFHNYKGVIGYQGPAESSISKGSTMHELMLTLQVTNTIAQAVTNICTIIAKVEILESCETGYARYSVFLSLKEDLEKEEVEAGIGERE
ncbi:hypothetical protein RhiirC2_853412 [Rhizophagus irregularis]|uniref:Uncharacterized protein n=1 Tax=Rhizophagus irregularis TaxID=588596 RepID=A0A2N1MVS4_9GLOM|nr:hypothetical protein RhiirC2_853412 [Rhizophagus irregularis]